MCVPIRQRDARTRFLLLIGNLSLAIGIILWTFVRPSIAAGHAWLDGLCGLLIGFSIAVNLGALVRARRCGGQQT
jgi:hypothetical protein